VKTRLKSLRTSKILHFIKKNEVAQISHFTNEFPGPFFAARQTKIAYLMKSKRAFENHSAITQSDQFRFRHLFKMT